jgi:hypothetical protein
MARKLYRWDSENKVFIELNVEPAKAEVPAVHQDSFGKPLKHPVTGEVVESKTRWNEINKEHNLQVVGNDLLSQKPRNIQDRITEDRIKTAMERAEAIHSDPAKRNAYRNQQAELAERNARLLNGYKR